MISTIGVLGLSKLQVNSLVSNQQAQYSSQVTWQLYNIVEKMRTNLPAASGGFFLNTPVNNNCRSASCTPEDMAESDIFNWNADNASLFPSGVGTITQPGGTGNAFVITIRWDGNRSGATGTGCDVTNATDLLCNSISVNIN